MLKPYYLIHGGELLQTQEAVMSIKHNCFENGYTKHEVFEIERGFDWASLNSAMCELDMFADKKLLEIRVNAPLNKVEQQAFEQILDLPNQDRVILVVAKKLNAEVLHHSWVKKISHHGEIIEIKNIPSYQWLPWVAKRLATMHLKATPEAIELLAKSYEGNLIELQQVLNNLQANHTEQLITIELCQNYVRNNSVLSVFEISQAIMAANSTRILRIMQSLRDNQVEPSLILWSITKEIRLLIKLGNHLTQHKLSDEMLGKKYNIWPKNVARYKALLQKNTIKDLKKLLCLAHKIDLAIKGAENLNVFETLSLLCLKLVSSNVNLVSTEGVNL